MRGRQCSLIVLALLLIAPISNGFVGKVSADSSITLDLSSALLVLTPGMAANTTLEITNNDTSIDDFNITLDESALCTCWNITITEENVSALYPYVTNEVEIIVRLNSPASMNDTGEAILNVTRSDGAFSVIRLYLNVGPQYMPSLNTSTVGQDRVVMMGPGTSMQFNLSVMNRGTANDTILLGINSVPDLGAFWAAMNGGNETGGNGTGNGTGENGTGNGTGENGTGNGTGGNGTGNETGGNGTGNGTGDNGTGNETGDNGTGNGTGENETSNSTNNETTNVFFARWVDDVIHDLESWRNASAELIIEVPNGTPTGSYGFDLHASSVNGNLTVSTTIVVNVTGFRAVAYTLNNSSILLPQMESAASILVSNAGTKVVEQTYSVTVSGPCTAVVATPDGALLMAGESEIVIVTIQTLPLAHHGDVCSLTLAADDGINDVNETWNVDLVVGINESVILTAAAINISLIPGMVETIRITVTNDGTEDVEARLQAVVSDDLQVTVPVDWTLVAAGSSSQIDITLIAPEGTTMLGEAMLNVTADLQSVDSSTLMNSTSAVLSIVADVQSWVGLRFMMPQSASWDVEPGATTAMPLYIVNDGTGATAATLVWNGLPAGLTLEAANGSMNIGPGSGTGAGAGATASTADPSLVAIAGSGLAAGSHSVSLSLVDVSSGQQLASAVGTVTVAARSNALLHSALSAIQVGHTGSVSTTISLSNSGNSADLFLLTTTTAPTGLHVVISPASVQLDSGASADITISMSEDSAAFAGGTLSITATPVVNEAANDTISFTTSVADARPEVTLSPSSQELSAGSNATLHAFLVNRGVSDETYLLEVASDLDCQLTNDRVPVSSGSAAIEIDFTCAASTMLDAGEHAVMLTARPLSAPTLNASDSVVVTVLPYTMTNGDMPLSITVSGDEMALTSGGTLTLEIIIHNIGNENRSGVLLLGGQDATGLARTWMKPSTGGGLPSYDLAPGQKMTLQLELTSPEDEGGLRTLWLEAAETGGGRAQSESFTITVDAKHEPPNGVALPLGFEADNQTTMAMIGSGWILALLTIIVLNFILKRKPAGIDAASTAAVTVATMPEPAAPAPLSEPLAADETRPDGDVTSCPHCQARSRLPADKEPPYRFRCPSCDEMVRVVS